MDGLDAGRGNANLVIVAFSLGMGLISEGPAPAAISDEDEARLDPEGPKARELGEGHTE